MKKLFIVLMVAGFIGLTFAYTPARVTSNTQDGVSLLEDSTKTTKTKKTTATKKEDCTKKSCCKSTCNDKSKTTKETNKEKK